MKRLLSVPVVALALVGLVACGSDKKSTSSSSKDTSSTTSSSSTSGSTTSAKTPPVFEISAGGGDGHWAFKLPDGGITGGVVTLRLKNESAKDTHDFQLIKVDGKHTPDEVAKIVGGNGPISNDFHGWGGVGTVAPGQTGETTLNLAPGHYVYLCTDETDGKPHAQNGMLGELDVTGDSGATLPATTATVEASDYKYTNTGLKAGDNMVAFKNSGTQIHMALAVPILPGKTLDDVKAFFASQNNSGPPPVDFQNASTAQAIDPGQTLVIPWKLKPGKYAFLCFVTDRAGGPPHFTKGMLQEVDIT